MKKGVILLVAALWCAALQARPECSSPTEAEIFFPDSLGRIAGLRSDSLIYFTSDFSTPVTFPVNRFELPDPPQLESAGRLLDEIRRDSALQLTCIWIGGSASPEGPTAWNRLLGERRAAALARSIRERFEIPASRLRITNLAEDWRSVELTLAADGQIPHRDELLDIIRTEPNPEIRKRRIRELDNGHTWQQLIRRLFPPLRNARMVVVYQRPQTDGIGGEFQFPSGSPTLLRSELTPLPATRPTPSNETAGRWRIALKSNLLFDAALMANLGAEVSPWRHWSLDVPVWYSPYDITSTRRSRLLAVQPEVRWWLDQAMRGHFVGLHTHVVGFNLALDNHARYQDPNHALWGLGLSYGYALTLGSAGRWGIEFTLGAGFARYRYDAYRNWPNGPKFDSGAGCYWGVTRAGITLSYQWEIKRQNRKRP